MIFLINGVLRMETKADLSEQKTNFYFSKDEKINFKYSSLFQYNDEVSRGIIHTDQWKCKMSLLNEEYLSEKT